MFLLSFSLSFTPAIMNVMLSQRCGKILVGDPHQQIYTFKGAVNALQIVDHTHIYYLTQVSTHTQHAAYVQCLRLKNMLVSID